MPIAGPATRNAFVLWALSFGLVLAAHLTVLVAVLAQSPPAVEGIPSDAILIDLSAEPSILPTNPEATLGAPLDEPAASSTDSVAQSQQDLAEPKAPPEVSEKVLPEPQIELPPELPPVTEADITLPQMAEPPKQVEQETSQPHLPQPSEERLGSAPVAAAGGRTSGDRVATWKSTLAVHLARKRRYPAEAHRKRQQGVVTVRFTLDRSGRVILSSIVKGSGFPALDRESLAMILRAQPFPAPPREAPDPIEIVAPIQFSLE